MRDAIAALRDERARLAARIERLDSILSRHDELEREAEDLLGATDVDTALAVQAGGHVETRSQVDGTPLSEFIVAATEIFKETSAPLPRKDAFARFEERGIKIAGADPLNVMTTRFNRMPNLTNLRGFGYWLASRAYEPAGYIPTGSTEDDLAPDEQWSDVESGE